VIPPEISNELKNCYLNIGQQVLDHIRCNLRQFNKSSIKTPIDGFLTLDLIADGVNQLEQLCFSYMKSVVVPRQAPANFSKD
jgi:hypothetical protein